MLSIIQRTRPRNSRDTDCATEPTQPIHMSISVAIVEDEARIRAQLVTTINEAPGFRCQGTFSSGEEGLREISRQPPDVVLMDINLPKMSGVECTYRLKKLVPKVQIVMLTVYEDSEQIFKALEMG